MFLIFPRKYKEGLETQTLIKFMTQLLCIFNFKQLACKMVKKGTKMQEFLNL